MAKYRVKRAWHGVKVGQELEIENLHSALVPNVELIPEPEKPKEQPPAVIAGVKKT